MSEIAASIAVAAMSLIGTLADSYMSNRRSGALITYRLEQLEKKVDRLEGKVDERHG